MKTLNCLFLLLFTISLFAQPEPSARMIAEWEPALGTLIRWPLGIPSDLVVELAEDDSLYVLVEDTYQQQQANYTFSSWGVNLDHCRFIFADTYSHWTRDWGPQCLFDGNGQFGILDPMFDGYPWVPPTSRDWSQDDAVNAAFAQQMGWNNYQLPAYLTGGNVMYDGYNSAFSSQQMLSENLPLMSNADFFDLMQEYAGIENYNIISNFENMGIQHIDCIAKLLDEETVLIKEVDFWHPEYTLIENVAAEFATFTNVFGRPYNIIRIFCDYYQGNNVAAYTNSYILNKKVFVPLFNIPADDDAIATFQQAMPGYEVIGFPWGAWYYYDALHCRVMGIFDPDMIRIEHDPLTGTIISDDDYQIDCRILDYSQQGLIAEELFLIWKTSTAADWEEILLEPTTADSFFAAIPHQPEGTEVFYYLAAESLSGRTATKPITSPDAYFTFICENLTGTENQMIVQSFNLKIFPNPFNPSTTISFIISNKQNEQLEPEIIIYNLKGQEVKTLPVSSSQSLKISVIWNGSDNNNQPVSSGVYFVKLQAGAFSVTKKCLLMK